MRTGDAAKRLLAHPRIRALATDLAIKAGAVAVMRGAERLFPAKPKPKPSAKVRVIKAAAPIAALAGAGALARMLYRRSEARRKRHSQTKR